ncbi:MAG: 50S ribosomal protein L32 [Candidatus Spechtbacterales bacterium]
MAVPKNRHTKSRRDTKRSHLKLKAAVSVRCEKCSVPVMPHLMCENCGTYKGREMVDVLAKLTKKDRKAKEQELEQAQPAQSMEDLSKS